MHTAPYGNWSSPITAADLASSGHPAAGGHFVADGQLWWTELRPAEGGRQAIRRLGSDGEPVDVLPAPWNARTRVHEYGGACWLATDDLTVVFAEFSDQRLYRFTVGSEPTPITPETTAPASLRYADPQLCADGSEIWCIREMHSSDGVISRDLCAVPLDGSAANDGSAIRSIVSGSHFLANARLSPDGRRLAWIAWDHPQMPWDGTELRIGELTDSGQVTDFTTILGSTVESVLQPEWINNESLYAISDRTGWWNLYQLSLTGECTPLCPQEFDFGSPMWQLGMRWYSILGDGKLLTVRTFGSSRLAILDPSNGDLHDVELPGIGTLGLGEVRGNRVLLGCAGSETVGGIRLLDLTDGALTDVRLNIDSLPDARYLPIAELRTFADTGGREVHTLVYPPRNPEYTAPDGELPPYVAFVHGGPTAHVSPTVDLTVSYFTSRGIGVVDVNYGGSSGYGREYRERLRGQWGIVDVEDTVAAVLGLAAAGLADPNRLAIEGGSAGGWTVLAALTGTDVFACGVSYFGVAELVKFAQHTHDFESRYLDGLVGPLPEALSLYEERAPLNKVAGLSCPVLLLQGLDDPIVPPIQAEMFRDAMLEKGIPHAYLTYEGESHGFRKAESQISAREAELSFYGQVLGFEPPDIPVLALWRP